MATDLRGFFLGEEVLTSVRLIQKGLAEVQRIDGANDFYHPALLLLSSGLERLMKCILCLRSQAVGGDFPSAKQIKDYGHDLERLRDAVVAACFDDEYRGSRQAADIDAAFLESDLRLRALLTSLSRFARSARYYNLNMVGGDEPDTDSPEQEWAGLEMEVVSERPELWKALEAPSGSGPIFDAISREFVGRIEVFVRALCRLFTLGPLGDNARAYTGYLTPFLSLRNENLGRHDYRHGEHV